MHTVQAGIIPRQQRRRGYALILVLMVLALLSVGLATMFNKLGTSAKSTGAVIENRRLFYACDGTARSLVKVAQEYLQTGVPTTPGLLKHICLRGDGCSASDDGVLTLSSDPLPRLRPDGYVVKALDARSLNTVCEVDANCGTDGQCFKLPSAASGVCRTMAALPSGPFRGVRARQDQVLLSIEQGKGEHSCRIQQTLILAKLSMFQFFLFSDSEYTDWQPGPKSVARGRVHANGDLCIGGGDGFYLEQVTSAGDLNPMKSSRCRTPEAFGTANIFIARVDNADFDADNLPATVDPVAAHFRQFLATDRAQPPSWRQYGKTSWASHLLDQAHDVKPLKLPIRGAPTAQNGVASTGVVVSNNQNLRFLLEPPRTTSGSEDDPSVRAQKFAEKAMIRIIDGVWYLRTQPNQWPGEPIWSDHPGRYATKFSEGVVADGIAVGQADLFGAGARPLLYSAYATDAAHQLLDREYDPAHPASLIPSVISYGVVTRTPASFFSAGTAWEPAYRLLPDILRPAEVARLLLQGTRTGFRNGHAQRGLAPGVSQTALSTPANVLPINFDVAAFQRALASTTTNELGAVLRARGLTFNGVVFIDSTWPGSKTGTTGSSLPTLQAQGGANDASQPAIAVRGLDGLGDQRALPNALCSDSAVGDSVAVMTAPRFQHFTCERGSRPNAVRVINGRFINVDHTSSTPSGREPFISEGQLPNGLTIITPLPLYLLGDMNLSSNADELDRSRAAYQWAPLLVGGDVTYVQSNNWSDRNSRWDRPTDDTFDARVAATTTLNIELLTGWTVTRAGTGDVYSGGVENLIRLMEKWQSSDKLIVRGSLVISHAAVYDRWKRFNETGVALPPTRDWAFDNHLNDLSLQPPGAPSYDVTAVRQWQRH